MQKNEFEKFGKYSLCEKNGRPPQRLKKAA
jgi:hypothetical protein